MDIVAAQHILSGLDKAIMKPITYFHGGTHVRCTGIHELYLPMYSTCIAWRFGALVGVLLVGLLIHDHAVNCISACLSSALSFTVESHMYLSTALVSDVHGMLHVIELTALCVYLFSG